MKAYKGFNKLGDGTLNCRGFVYEVGKTYNHDGPVEVCKSGFHACHELHQCWQFYPNNGSNVFCEVECGGNIIESKWGDGKFACSEITILREVDMSGVDRFDASMFCFWEELIGVMKNNKCNYIGIDGKLISTEWFDVTWDFHNGFGVVKKNSRYNHLSKEGKLLSEEWWDDAESFGSTFSGAYARIKKDGKYNLIGTDGKLVQDEWFEYIQYPVSGITKVKLGGKYYNYDIENKTKTPSFQ